MNNHINMNDNILYRQALPTDGQGRSIEVKFDVNGFLESFGTDETIRLNSYSPVVQKRLDSEYQNNITITGRFRTNYTYGSATYHGGFSFIQVRKNSSGKASAYSGYGIAWRPSTAALDDQIAIVSAETGSLGTGYWDITYTGTIADPENMLMYLVYEDANGKLVSIPFHYTGNTTNILSGCYIPTVAKTDIEAETSYLAFMMPNLYIVDNDPMHGDNYASRYVIDPLTGLAFIQAASVVINKDTTYYFKMDINSDNSILFYLSETEGDLGNEGTLAIESGATTTLSEYLRGATMDSFGLSVFDTGGYQWWYDDIKIAKMAGEYSVAYFRFDTTDMSEDLQLEMSAYGESSDGNEVPTNGIVANVWNPAGAGSWDNILSAPLDTDYAILVSNIITRATYEEDNHITFMVTTRNPSTLTTPSAIYIDYIKLVRASVLGMHVGGCVDVYIDDPSTVYTSTMVTVDAESYYIDISSYLNLSSIYLGDVELMYGRDYIIVNGHPGTNNTTRSVAMAKFTKDYAGASVTINYWYSADITGLQALLNNNDHRPLTTDVLVRHKQIHEINLPGLDTTTKELVQDYLDALTYIDGIKTLSYSVLMQYLYGELGHYPSINIYINTFDDKKRRVANLDRMGTEYPISEIETFRIMDA